MINIGFNRPIFFLFHILFLVYICNVNNNKTNNIMTTAQNIAEYKKMVRLYNRNKSYLQKQISLQGYTELKNKYNAEDLCHLAKILMLRGIELN